MHSERARSPERAGSPHQSRLPAARRREQLLAVALDRFGERGFHATSMQDIADRAGVTKPVVYQHFSSKSKLYLELLETVGRQLLDAVTGSAVAEQTPHNRVLAGFRAYFRFVGERTSAFRLLMGTDARRSSEVASALRTVEDSFAATVAGFIRADIDDDHRQLLGYAIVGLAEVVGRQWVQRVGDAPVRQAAVLDPAEGDLLARQVTGLVWAGLRGLPGATHPE